MFHFHYTNVEKHVYSVCKVFFCAIERIAFSSVVQTFKVKKIMVKQWGMLGY